MSSRLISPRRIFLLSAVVLLAGILVELGAILFLNAGKLVYTLDDPYIHLALAENIRKGHYGINVHEYSAPSSSILWPFILSPGTFLPHSEYIPLFINVVCAIAALFLQGKIIQAAFGNNGEGRVHFLFVLILLLLIPCCNLIGLVFTGMEHTFQLFLVVLILWGLVYEIQNKQVFWWLGAAIVCAPLIRYENLAVSVPALLYLFWQRYRWLSTLSALLLAMLMGAYSVFLLSLGLDLFPASVLVKSPVISSGGSRAAILQNLQSNLSSAQGSLLAMGLLVFIFIALSEKRDLAERRLAISLALGIVSHLLVGRYGWYARYEVYIWATTLLAGLYLNGEKLKHVAMEMSAARFATVACLAAGLLCAPYIYVLLTTPLASNNIYRQQYQMHRFVTEYYRRPVGVNDIGYVAYQNEGYVLDFLGLASAEALTASKTKEYGGWMDRLSGSHDVRLAILYDDLFDIPRHWIKLADLHLGSWRVTSYRNRVTFYVLDSGHLAEVEGFLRDFQRSLPEGTRLEFAVQASRVEEDE